VKIGDNTQILACFILPLFFLSLSYSLPARVLPEHEKKFENMNPEFLEVLEVRVSSVCSLDPGRAAFGVLSINSVCGLSKKSLKVQIFPPR